MIAWQCWYNGISTLEISYVENYRKKKNRKLQVIWELYFYSILNMAAIENKPCDYFYCLIKELCQIGYSSLLLISLRILLKID